MSFFRNTSNPHIPGGTFSNVGRDINNAGRDINNAGRDTHSAGRDINITNIDPAEQFLGKRTVVAFTVLFVSTVFILLRSSRVSMSLLPNTSNAQIWGGIFNNAGRDMNKAGRDTNNAGRDIHITNTNSAQSIFSLLQEHNVPGAAYNTRDHESVPCQEGTRQDIMVQISKWTNDDDDRTILWLHGPAGSGKSTIAHTVAKERDAAKKLAASFFFSRGKPGRSDTSRFFATLAYQLAKFIPSIQLPMLETLQNNPSILSQSPQYQLQKLILSHIKPLATGSLVVIDGLDECDEEDSVNLIRALASANLEHPLPFRLLIASRANEHIPETFTPYLSKIYPFDLGKFHADNDIRTFFQHRFAELHRQKQRIMTAVKPPWPSDTDLDRLVQKAEGLFVYASTLVKFVADGQGLPHGKLQSAVERHDGLDHLYEQVLSDAPHSGTDTFRRIIGTLLFLFNPLSINELTRLLRVDDPGIILVTLHGCGSILNIPDDNDKAIQVFHASLRDFLVDVHCSKNFFIDPTECHISILDDCVQIMTMDFTILSNGSGRDDNEGKQSGQALSYASQHWYRHMTSIAQVDGGIGRVNSYFGRHLVDFLAGIELNWFNLWIGCGLRLISIGNDLFRLISTIEGYSHCPSELCNRLRRLLESLNAAIPDPGRPQAVCDAIDPLRKLGLLPHPEMCT